jgi:hypothetical protein
MSITAMKVEGPLHVVCQCDKCKLEKQEPVLWQWKDSEMVTPFDKTNVEGWTPLYTTPQPQQEPVGINGLTEKETNATASVFGLVKDAPQPQREWVGLTEEDIIDCLGETYWGDIIKKAEAKLKEKNT